MPLNKKQGKNLFKKVNQRDVSKLLTIMATKLLTRKQEKELFKKIADGDKKAASELVNANLFLVDKIAEKYENNDRKVKLSELKKQCKIGLKKAVGKYNPEKDYKFSTYATWWIRQAIHLKLGI